MFLVPCEYEATRHGIPVPKLVYYDPYIQQMIKSISNKHIDEPRATLRLGQRRRNSYFHYSKKGNNNINTDDSYHCDRLFCKHCIKSNY